jgi:plastocyanin
VTVIAKVTAFHVVGACFAAWAVLVALLGITREGFPRTLMQGRLVGAISVLLAVGAIGSAIYVGATEKGEAKGERAGPALKPSAHPLRLRADPSGKLKFDKNSLSASAGVVTVAMTNPSPIDHDVAITGNGVAQTGKIVKGGGTSTVTAKLRPGTYTFFCSVDGHRQAGMQGKLTVR